MRIAFRVDASVDIGTGHIMRCLTLADELKRHGHQCYFICRDHSGHLGELITSKGYELSLLSGLKSIEGHLSQEADNAYAHWLGVSWQYDAKQTIDSLYANVTDWLIVDHYALDARWEQKIAPEVGQIMVIDDLADRPHDCSLLLDQNHGRKLKDYDGLLPMRTVCLIGPSYALLRREFSHLREKSLQRRQNIELKRILISLGGVDRLNVTGQVLAALSETLLSPDIELDIIMGSSAPALRKIQAQADTLPFRATVNVNANDMAERMFLADLSIGAAGSTSWERSCLGLPTIMIILAENQRLIGEAIAKSKAAFLIEDSQIADHLSTFINQFIESTEELHTCSQNASKICDGNGTARTVSMLTRSYPD